MMSGKLEHQFRPVSQMLPGTIRVAIEQQNDLDAFALGVGCSGQDMRQEAQGDIVQHGSYAVGSRSGCFRNDRRRYWTHRLLCLMGQGE